MIRHHIESVTFRFTHGGELRFSDSESTIPEELVDQLSINPKNYEPCIDLIAAQIAEDTAALKGESDGSKN